LRKITRNGFANSLFDILDMMASYVLLEIALVLVLSLYSICANDMSLNYYTPAGEVAQIAYAAKLVERGPPTIGWVSKSGRFAVVLKVSKRDSTLMVPSNREIAKLSAGMAAVATGYPPDLMPFLKEAVAVVATHNHIFSEPPSADKVRLRLSKWLTKGMYIKPKSGDEEEEFIPSRPMAAYMLLAHTNNGNERSKNDGSGAQLTCIRNDGICCSCNFICLGGISEGCSKKLNELLQSVDEASTEELRSGVMSAARYLVHKLEGGPYSIDCAITCRDGSSLVYDRIISLTDFAKELSVT
jgi:20S proteasome alpha/beta subunit